MDEKADKAAQLASGGFHFARVLCVAMIGCVVFCLSWTVFERLPTNRTWMWDVWKAESAVVSAIGAFLHSFGRYLLGYALFCWTVGCGAWLVARRRAGLRFAFVAITGFAVLAAIWRLLPLPAREPSVDNWSIVEPGVEE